MVTTGAEFISTSSTVAELFTATQVGGFLVVPNEGLKPERSLAGELGVQRLITSWLALDVAGFFYDFENLIEADTVLRSEGVIEISFDNLQEARILGLEAIARVSFLGDRLLGQAAYTFLDTDDGNGEPLAYRPQHLLTASGQLDLGFRLLNPEITLPHVRTIIFGIGNHGFRVRQRHFSRGFRPQPCQAEIRRKIRIR